MTEPIIDKENNELPNMPGFFFHPKNEEGLEKLSDSARSGCLERILGHYLPPAPPPPPLGHRGIYLDFLCSMDNNRAPTHRKIGVPFPWEVKEEKLPLTNEVIGFIVDRHTNPLPFIDLHDPLIPMGSESDNSSTKDKKLVNAKVTLINDIIDINRTSLFETSTLEEALELANAEVYDPHRKVVFYFDVKNIEVGAETPTLKFKHEWTMTVSQKFTNKMRPIHPGEILREEFLKNSTVTVETMVDKSQASKEDLQDLVDEKGRVTLEIAKLLASTFGNSKEFWLNLQAEYDRKTKGNQ